MYGCLLFRSGAYILSFSSCCCFPPRSTDVAWGTSVCRPAIGHQYSEFFFQGGKLVWGGFDPLREVLLSSAHRMERHTSPSLKRKKVYYLQGLDTPPLSQSTAKELASLYTRSILISRRVLWVVIFTSVSWELFKASNFEGNPKLNKVSGN